MNLVNHVTDETVRLKAHHTFGRRTSSVDTVLAGSDVSQVHASIRWTGDAWVLYDHSRNGTWINGERVTRIIEPY